MADSINIWLHHMKKVTYIPEFRTECEDDPNNWTKKAMKVLGGNQWYETYLEAQAREVIVVGGNA